MSTITVWCLLIDHQDRPLGGTFKVYVENDKGDIADLKEKVKERSPIMLQAHESYELTVWQCTKPRVFANQGRKAIGEVIKAINLRENAEVVELASANQVKRLELSEDEVLLVRRPASSSLSGIVPNSRPLYHPPLPDIENVITRRSLTVDALYKRLNKYKLVMVRGTPASGKTTLARLLTHHIAAEEPTSHLISINRWRTKDELNMNPNLFSYLMTHGYSLEGGNIVIFDDAQTSYWDDDLWGHLLKSITPNSWNRFILFASYGSPSTNTVHITPMVLGKAQQIDLRPIDFKDGIPSAGLFLTTDEFIDMVRKLIPAYRFTEDFLDYVYYVTVGHAGAVHDLLQMVLSGNSYRTLGVNNREYSLEIFRREFPLHKIWSNLEGGSIFRRGLPPLYRLQESPIARVFRTVLSNNHVTREGLGDSDEDKTALDTCFSRGWLHAALSPIKDPLKTEYVFATPLHQWFIGYHLGTLTLDPTVIQEPTLSEFAINVIRRFSCLRLSSPRQVGVSDIQRPPEAQFQDEFYRCCAEHSNGSVFTLPEFGNASGRIDFYIPCKKWGVEITRDGDRVKDHSSRFLDSGPYAEMRLDKYIILDFRRNRPRKRHPSMPELYHVVLGTGYRNVQVLAGPSLNMVAQFELLNY